MDEQQKCDYLIGRIVRLADNISPARYHSTRDWLRLHRDFSQLSQFAAMLEDELINDGGNPGESYLTKLQSAWEQTEHR